MSSGPQRPTLAVDCVLLGLGDEGLNLFCLRREDEPYLDQAVLPGGLLRLEETLEQGCERLLREKTGFLPARFRQIGAFDALGRDPRGRVISSAMLGLVNLEAADRDAGWRPLDAWKPMAFDHEKMARAGLSMLKALIAYQPVAFELLGDKFSLGQLQRAYEAVLERPVDKRNFRRRALSTNCLQSLTEHEKGVPHRAARLYRFDKRRAGLKSGPFTLV
ncbi:MAG: NUDIX hydrolase [Deltaproteobacteria bacterium]|nr:NUDIX hydrolase [Deltaproteobacteria bacterium]